MTTRKRRKVIAITIGGKPVRIVQHVHANGRQYVNVVTSDGKPRTIRTHG